MKYILAAIFILFPAIAVAQDHKPPPLNESEKRTVLLQLYELEAVRAKVAAYEDWIKRETELYEREKIIQRQAIENERRATEIAIRERDLARDQAEFYKNLYESVTQKRGGIGCTLAKIFTLGLYRCK